VHDHGNRAAEILPKELMREGELAEHLKLEKAAGHEDQHEHEGFECDEKGYPPEIGDPDALRVEVCDRQTGQEDEELDRGENSLHGRPLGRISFFKLFRCITRHRVEIGSVMETARSARRNDGEYSKIGWMAKLRGLGVEVGCQALFGGFFSVIARRVATWQSS